MRYQKTEWGISVKIFTQRYGITMKEIASQCGISYNTLLQVIIGKTPGEKAAVTDKVDAFMESYTETAEPTVALRPFEEVTPCNQPTPDQSRPTSETSRFSGNFAPSTSRT